MSDVLYQATKYMNAEDTLLAREEKPKKREKQEDAQQEKGQKMTRIGDQREDRSSKPDGDQGTTSKDLVQVPIGPVTRAQAKKFKDVLNGLIQELWAQANSWRPTEHDPRGQQRIVILIQVLEGSGQG